MNDLPHLLAILVLVVGVPLNGLVAWLQLRETRAAPHLRVLKERLVAELAVLSLVLVFGFIFINNDFPEPPILTDATKLITRAAMLVVAIVPALYWLRLYWRGRR